MKRTCDQCGIKEQSKDIGTAVHLCKRCFEALMEFRKKSNKLRGTQYIILKWEGTK